MADQTRTFATKTEVDYRIGSVDKQLENDQQWQRRIELKFSEYATAARMDSYQGDVADWRREVDGKLTAAASKSSLIYAIIAIAIAAGGLLIATFNLFAKMPHIGG